MVSVQQVESGLARYLDTELMPQMHMAGWKQYAIATAMSVMVKRIGTAIDRYTDNPYLTAFGITGADGIDLDIIAQEAKAKMPNEGIKVSVPGLGELTFRASDVDTIYRCITGGAL